MFRVAYRSESRRKVQHGIRDLTMTKWKCCYKAFVKALGSLCTGSSFSPLRFVFRSKRLKIDVFLWISITIALTIITAIFVHNFLTKFDKMSTRTYVQTHQESTAAVRFPGITVCATPSYTYTKVYGFLHSHITENPILRSSVNLTKILNTFMLKKVSQDDLDEMDIVLTVNNITMRDVLYHTSPDCDELLQRCEWEGRVRSCSQLFRKLLGGSSFCCSFNYDPETIKYTRTTSFGRGEGLSLVTRPMRDKYFRRSDYGKTIRIIVHPVVLFPLINENDILVPMQKETFIELDNVYNVANLNVLQQPFQSRGCRFYFESESPHFPFYRNLRKINLTKIPLVKICSEGDIFAGISAHANCILDCRINKIIRACGCASYYYPSGNATICPASKLFCSKRNQYLDGTTNTDGTISVENCDCPGDCIMQRIHYRIQSTGFVCNNFTVDEFYNGISEDNGIVHINFGKSFVKVLNRKLVLDKMELASYIGGFFALFLGCSFMSILEILYFLSVRFFANYRRLCIQNCLVSVPTYLE